MSTSDEIELTDRNLLGKRRALRPDEQIEDTGNRFRWQFKMPAGGWFAHISYLLAQLPGSVQ